ncbi:hypothetical protein P106B_12 [Rhizobium phage vB_RglS_P106B]|uniref:Uncharacterized protein n=1 Tax=Rhizobium phage vB_RglS_P106B TaxID=1458697 RepID=W6E8D9_9CAUD|nr:hypothetical protein P106B_12 [Rhizobium phage vB_RglS_P106B]AHJ10695.1 hypothetical protein P106B_12 [Rhizobium phage vB_RglS_P106B]
MVTTIKAGNEDTFLIEPGSIVIVKGSALATGSIWFTRSAVQDVLAKTIVADGNYPFGPFGQRCEIRVECVTGSVEVSTDFAANPVPSEIARQMGTLRKSISGAAYTLSDDDHGYMLQFAAACTVTIAKNLRDDFSCGWSQESAGAVTFAIAAGVTLNSKGGVFASSAQYSVGGLAAFGFNNYRLFGV